MKAGASSFFWLGFPAFAAVFAMLPIASAQDPTNAADRARLLREQSQLPSPSVTTEEGVEQGYAATSPNDTDLGEQQILKRTEKYEAFTFETGAPIYYTSNVALVDRGEVGDLIIAPVVGLTYSPKFIGTLSGEFTLRQQFFYYNDNSSFNFASFDAIAGVNYYLPKLNNLALHAAFDYNRLTETDSFNDFFSNYSLLLSAELPIPLSRAQQLSFGINADVSLYADPSPPQRNDVGVFAAYAVSVTRALDLAAVANIVFRPYDAGGRTDLSELLSLSANYRIGNNLTLSALTSFVANQSNRSIFDYHVFNAGGAVALTWRF